MKLYWLTIIAFGLFSSRFVYADDTEIYRNTKNRINPNVVFLIDTSGSMAYEADNSSEPENYEDSRLEIVQKSAVNAISQLDPSLPINISIMRFDETWDRYDGAYVLQPFIATDSEADKNKLIDSINSMSLDNIGGGTPITESIYEAYLYITGQSPRFGEVRTSYHGNLEAMSTYFNYYGSLNYQRRFVSRLGSAADSMSGGKYKSPVEATCQKNHIVLFTDGLPSSDNQVNGFVNDKMDYSKYPDLPNDLSRHCNGNGGCTDELAYFLQNTDHFNDEDITGSVDVNASEVNQPIYVHTVGGFSGVGDDGEEYLNNIAKYGHPLNQEHLNGDGTSKHFYKADNETGLTAALLKVFGGIANTAGNFAAPVVAVNAFNSLEHREELYYSVFKPSEMPGWSGNIKRYKMNHDGIIQDQDSVAAIDPATGYFKDSAKSFWTSGSPDGADVPAGGIAHKLTANRAVYTNLKGFGAIRQNENRIHEDTSGITTAMLDDNLPNGTNLTSENRKSILQWGRGIDPTTGAARHTLADPLHGNPMLVSYRNTSGNISDLLYTGTNVGYIHAFKTDLNDPGELWAFMPKELLPNLAVYQREEGNLLKAYGIDGPLSTHHDDKNRDGVVDADDTIFLAAGMRRGGHSYYALDISEADNPRFEAQITSGDPGFEELGQTWSRMLPATVMWKGQETEVFFFGGGYDTDEDNATTRITHDVGNAIYMVKANNEGSGNIFDLLWKANGNYSSQHGLYSSDMTSSFAGDLSLVDNNGDGTVDLIYGADVGGRIWRFDIKEGNSGHSNFAEGGVIADFNDGTVAGNTRFYTQPDVIYTNYGQFEFPNPDDPDKHIFKKLARYQIAIGSGYRAGPLSTETTDHLFVINDFDINKAPTNGYQSVDISDLANHDSFDSASLQQKRNGFYITLQDQGEKILSTTLTVNDVIYAPTFRPSNNAIEVGCEPDAGQARVLLINPYEAPDTTERNVQQIELNQGGIVPKPVLVFPPANPTTGASSKPVIAIGTEILPAEGNFTMFRKTYWREE
ncbi:MAG: hypothetical protein CMH98_14260 [Oceanospirillaceae bacterium]|nr:hypothetical protein [Oceanospirillaceae bacterium]|tara:strand:- start:70527 stop:73607 length:3081 start_codon:yes stop_codon:yes gene_type:complete